ncbi:MAG: PIN domain-containing protein [Candidatus Riflebacteria bacterium]|nr:PIN domain-containing protein [Candidatus Riflebacteria bacterium]
MKTIKLACLDTQILIWGIRKEATGNQTKMIEKAEVFLQQLSTNYSAVLLPSIVIAEFLVKIPYSNHPQTISAFSKKFRIAHFDLKVASQYAKIWRERPQIETTKDPFISKRDIKADCMIIATALAHEAEVIYSHDDGLKKMAAGKIEVRQMITDTLLDYVSETS